MENIYELEIEILGRRGTWAAIGETLEQAIDSTKQLIFMVTGYYPIVLSNKETIKG